MSALDASLVFYGLFGAFTVGCYFGFAYAKQEDQ